MPLFPVGVKVSRETSLRHLFYHSLLRSPRRNGLTGGEDANAPPMMERGIEVSARQANVRNLYRPGRTKAVTAIIR